MTHICADAATRAAKDFGFTCVVIGDACATRDLEIQRETVAAGEVQKSFLAAFIIFIQQQKRTKILGQEIRYQPLTEVLQL